MTKRAAIYCRVSRAYQEENEERTTIEDQLVACEKYCLQKGYEIVANYIDKDKYRVRKALVNPSGTRQDRPAYIAMLKGARAGEFDMIVSWKQNRLYRGFGVVPLSNLLDEVKDLDIELVTERFDRKTMGIMAAIAKMQIDDQKESMVRGRKSRLNRGDTPGGQIRYGYFRDENKHLIINHDEAQIVRNVFEWYIAGYNNMEIRRRLIALEISPRINRVWSKATINNILTFSGYATGIYIVKLDNEIFTLQCEPIISMATWDKAVETRQNNIAWRSRNVKEDYLCRGLVVCPCEWKMTARTSTASKRYTGKWGFYACTKHDHKPEEQHPDCPGTIGSKKLDDYVWGFIVKICRNPEILQAAIDARIAQLQAEQGDIEAEAIKYQNDLDSIVMERQWVITKARKGQISEDDMEMQLTAIEFQTLDLRKKLNEKLSAIAVQQQVESLKKWADDFLENIATGLWALETDAANFSDDDREIVYQALEASQYEGKFNGDKLAALDWAIFEEKRNVVKRLVDRVLVVKGENKEKKIIPMMALEIPSHFASLVYDVQSLAYVEQARKLAGDTR